MSDNRETTNPAGDLCAPIPEGMNRDWADQMLDAAAKAKHLLSLISFSAYSLESVLRALVDLNPKGKATEELAAILAGLDELNVADCGDAVHRIHESISIEVFKVLKAADLSHGRRRRTLVELATEPVDDLTPVQRLQQYQNLVAWDLRDRGMVDIKGDWGTNEPVAK